MGANGLTDALRETLAVFTESGEPRTTPDVADELDLGRRSTYARLERLADRDRLRTKKVGANARVWWRPAVVEDADRTQFDSLVDAVSEYAIFLLDADGYVQTWNPGAERIKGYEADEIVGRHVSTFYTDADREANVPAQNLAAAAEAGSIQNEGWRRRADGERFWANVSLSAIYDDGELDGYAKVTRDMTERREYERQLRRERDLSEQLLETAPVSLGVVDADGEIQRTNARAKRQFGLDDGSIETVSDVDVDDADGETITAATHPITHVVETGERIDDWQVRHERPDGERRWVSVTAAPLPTDDDPAVVVAGKDVTDIKRAERRLSRERDELRAELDAVFERIDDGVFAVDEEWTLTFVNETTAAAIGADPETIVGESLWSAFPGLEGTEFEAVFRNAMEDQEPQSVEGYYEPFDGWVREVAYPSETGLSVYFRDISDRKARERELERYETIVEAVNDGIYVVDEDGRFTLVNDTYASMTGHSRDELEGAAVSAVIDDESLIEAAKELEASLVSGDRESASLEAEFGDLSRIGEASFAIMDTDDGYERIGVVRDVTDRKEREHALERYQRIVETVDDGIYVLDGDDRFELVNDGLCEMTGYDRATLLGAHAETIFGEAFHEIARERRAALEAGDISIAAIEENIHRRDGSSIVVDSRFTLFDVDDEIGRVGVVRDVTDRKERERALERQREQLAASNSLHEVVSDVTEAVITQSTREEIEETVCRRLARANSYQFAWIAEVDPSTQTVSARTEAGVDGYLDDTTISVDPEDRHSRGPTGQAFATGEVQTTRDVEMEWQDTPWQSHATDYDIRSSAAIPITHEETVYGVLNVYAGRPRAFEGRERELVSRLGEIVGHAIAAAERKQALMSEEVVELAFSMQDVFEALDIPGGTAGTITLDHAVPTGANAFTVFGTVTPDAIETVRAATDALPHWRSISVSDGGDPIEFEVELTDPPVLSTVASLGGTVDHVTIEAGDLRLAILLSPTVDVHRAIEAVEEAYPEAELIRRRQRTRAEVDPGPVLSPVEELTERQRTTLETAYHAGYFQWPRNRSGEAVAESLDIAPATFHQHLRKAQQKVYDAVFSSHIDL
ncbi:PAS domain S-box protein [Halovivax cerinus]|uniref:PAS domain S-box protein n=1 Tax=Halovivax cerinus TaxID=1487865 RepID=A0ABD5NK63_9EURY|nr:PAS domain S-box protein [Halovivax cerinus]